MKILKWTGRVLVGVVVVIMVGIGAVYAISSWQLNHPEPAAPLADIFIPASAEAIQRGEHLVKTHGCIGCHGEGMAGRVAFEHPLFGRAVAPNLPKLLRDYSVSVLDAGIRQGIGHDGRALWMMPSEEYHYFTDDDVKALLAYLKTQPVVDNELPKPSAGPLLRTLLVLGKLETANKAVQSATPMIYDSQLEPQLARGEYIARTSCSNCHGADFKGTAKGPMTTPDLIIVKAYNRDDFGQLMRQGIPMGGRELDLMKEVALNNFKNLTEQEVIDLHLFLQSLN